MANVVAPAQPPSHMLVEQGFAAGTEAFLDELLRARWSGSKPDQALLYRLAARWYRDPRPAMREMLERYVDDGCDRPYQRLLVKALYRLAVAAHDDALVGRFMVSFDRFLQRGIVKTKRWHYDPALRRSTPFESEYLRCASHFPFTARHRWNKKLDPQPPHFARLTRMYLARSALRYFRRLGRKDPARFFSALVPLLARYEDSNLRTPAQLLDAWGLLGLLYHRHPVIDRSDRRGAQVTPGRTLGELTPSPMYPAVWQGHSESLFDLVIGARSNTVRAWAASYLRSDFADAMRSLPFAKLRALLTSPHLPAQQLGAAFLADAQGLSSLSIDAWFELLRIEDVGVLAVISDLFNRYVLPARVPLARCVELACARPAPLAELGWRWVRERVGRAPSAQELAALMPLTNAGSVLVRGEASVWLAERIERSGTPAQLRELLDARHEDVRSAALALMTEGRFSDETLLWSALAESPYGDCRDFLVKHLTQRLPQLAPDAVRFVWATTLLSVHRGSRARRLVLAQLSEQLVAHPAEAGEVLPLLRVALRSVRPAERRGALGAVSRAAFREPALREAIAQSMPELELFASEETNVRVPA